jgi:hypothetical protein
MCDDVPLVHCEFVPFWFQTWSCACVHLTLFIRREGELPLHLAIQSRKFEIMRLLVGAGADVNMPDG